MDTVQYVEEFRCVWTDYFAFPYDSRNGVRQVYYSNAHATLRECYAELQSMMKGWYPDDLQQSGTVDFEIRVVGLSNWQHMQGQSVRLQTLKEAGLPC